MPAAASKKPMAYREGRADKTKKPSIEVEINPEGEEKEEGMEGQEMDSAKTSRKRSAKGVKNTKAPMDGECGCGGTKKGKKCSCDGGCSGYTKKMDRADALTPQEYLAACDLGIQGRSRSYIRARLDAAERLDKKCGASGIADNKKCHVGTGTAPADQGKGGSALGNALKIAAVGAGVGLAAKTAYTMYQSREREVPIFKIRNKKGKTVAEIGRVHMTGAPGHDNVASAVSAAFKDRKNKRTKPKGFKRRDSMYAKGFSVETTALAI